VRRLALLCVIALLPSYGYAAGGADPFAFLLLPADPRQAAMGGAAAAQTAGSAAIFYNPAGLAYGGRHSAAFMHNEQFQGVKQEVLSLGLRNGLGFGFNFLDFGDIPRTTVSNPTGSGLGQFGASDTSLSVGYGRAVNDSAALGVTAKYVREAIDGIAASGLAIDLGGQVDLLRKYDMPLSFGLAIQNVGLTQPKFRTRSESFPVVLRFGGAYRWKLGAHGFLAALDLVRQHRDGVTFHPGVQWSPAESFSVRLGYNGRNDAGSGFTTGLSWRYKDAGLHYAFAPFGELGSANRFSLSMKFGEGGGAVASGRVEKRLAAADTDQP
jgi:hypothetical protein